MPNRRNFLKAAGVVAAGSVVAPNLATAAAQSTSKTSGQLTEHKLPPLPYAYDALEPYISRRIMELHHDKHHAGYVKGLNKAEKELAKARATDDFSLIQYWSRKAAFNGGGHFLHSMFWKVMAPAGKGGGGKPKGQLLKMIERDFGSFEAFKAQFSAAAKSVEGSGWGLLHYRPADDRLLVLQAENQQKLSPWGSTPVMGIDVWEHAYYLQYENKRAAYIEAWWNIVNWEQVWQNILDLRE